MRAGTYVQQPSGYKAFVPAMLPPKPPVTMGAEMVRLLSDADRALGRLDGVATVLPNPDLFVAMYVRQEAVFSSQIEGTQSTLEDVLEFEAGGASRVAERIKDVEEVVRYIAAINHGLQRLPKLPLSLRLIREIHKKLLKGVRGSQRDPGNFRRTQNWVGPADCTLEDATFIPPPAHEMNAALDNLEKFLHDQESLPVLIQCGLAHAQFETIHPFLDGNGRIGRLLITLLLCERKVLQQPLLYLSYYLKAHRAQYYDRLDSIRNDGDWEGWLKFFLRGVCEVSLIAARTAQAILKMREQHRQKLTGDARALTLLDFLLQTPIITVRMAEQQLGCSYLTANNLIYGLEHMGILKEITGKKRYRYYRYEPYMGLFVTQALKISQVAQETETPTTLSESPNT